MGEAKRRQEILGECYGIPETSKRKLHNSKIENPLPIADGLMPDYGTYCVKTSGIMRRYVYIANPEIVIGSSEGNICWNAEGYMATLIVTPEFAREYQKNPSQMLCIVPDPEDAYTTPLGERVIPFRLATT
jgi:hypothetical protein